MLQVEAIRTAQEKYGKGKVMTSEQVRWGLENLNLTQERLNELGFGKIIRPVKTRSEEHTSELQSQSNLVCRLLLEKKKKNIEHCLKQTGNTTTSIAAANIVTVSAMTSKAWTTSPRKMTVSLNWPVSTITLHRAPSRGHA